LLLFLLGWLLSFYCGRKELQNSALLLLLWWWWWFWVFSFYYCICFPAPTLPFGFQFSRSCWVEGFFFFLCV
jgi:hypothetical protein